MLFRWRRGGRRTLAGEPLFVPAHMVMPYASGYQDRREMESSIVISLLQPHSGFIKRALWVAREVQTGRTTAH
jgi:hypothetical protein